MASASSGSSRRLRRAGGGQVMLDASALLAWLVQEPGAEVVGGYLPRRLGHLGLQVEPFTAEDALLATEIFARDRRRVLSLADRCCLATAIRLALPAVTDDRAWMALDLDVKVLPFR
jgi:ribonuclease VapC